MRIDVLSLFPELFEPFVATSIIGRACQSGVVDIRLHNIRDYSTDKHRKVDDTPCGGGPGMVIRCQPVFDAVEQVLGQEQDVPAHTILMTPQGRTFTQKVAQELADKPRLVLIAGHYEGFDERIRLGLQPDEISTGDYVVSGGELPAMIVIDAIVRLQPGALGSADSTCEESFQDNRLEYPQYTRPRVFRGMAVPDVLLNGDHAKITQWRANAALERTQQRRPDLLDNDS